MPAGGAVFDREVISAEEAAERLGVSVATIKRWCQQGRLPAEKIGRQWLVDEASLRRVKPRVSPVTRPPAADVEAALRRVREFDLPDSAVPDILRYEDQLAQPRDICDGAGALLTGIRFPVPPIEVDSPKSPFFVRTISILELDELVAYEAAVATLVDRIEANLPPFVFGARRVSRSTGSKDRLGQWHQWRRSVMDCIRSGYGWMIKTDIVAFFDTVQHRLLFSDIDGLNPDGRVGQALKEMLRIWSSVPGLGLPQGPDASRVLGNLYLIPVDHALAAGAWLYFRYMDDIRIIGRTRAEAMAGLRVLERECKRRALVLSSQKTTMLNPRQSLQDWEDVTIATVQYHLDVGSYAAARRYLRALLRRALTTENALDIRAARFSLWRLFKMRDKALIRFVLDRLEDLAPVSSLVATFLRPWISDERVVAGLTSFFNNASRNTSAFLAAWILAACLDHPAPIPEAWARYARGVAVDRNAPPYLRVVAMSMAARFRPFIEGLRREASHEHDPAALRGYLVALARVNALDRVTREVAVVRASHLRRTVVYLSGRNRLPSLIDGSADVGIEV